MWQLSLLQKRNSTKICMCKYDVATGLLLWLVATATTTTISSYINMWAMEKKAFYLPAINVDPFFFLFSVLSFFRGWRFFNRGLSIPSTHKHQLSQKLLTHTHTLIHTHTHIHTQNSHTHTRTHTQKERKNEN
jgi:hypothetical protein